MTSRPSTAAPIVAVLAIVILLLLLPSAYVGGYLALGEYYEGEDGATRAPVTVRCFPEQWQRTVFRPAAWIEARITGLRTEVWPPLEDS